MGSLNKQNVTVVDDKIDSFDIDSSTEQVSSDKKSRAVSLEEVIVLDSLFLLELRVDADGVEEFLSEKLSQFFGSIDSVDEDDHLVEG